MDKRTTGIIATIATVLLCGLPGLLSVCVGAMMALMSFIPGAEIDMFGSSDPQSAFGFGIGALCVGVLFVLIPVVVGFLTLRRKPAPAAATAAPAVDDEPLPPAI